MTDFEQLYWVKWHAPVIDRLGILELSKNIVGLFIRYDRIKIMIRKKEWKDRRVNRYI